MLPVIEPIDDFVFVQRDMDEGEFVPGGKIQRTEQSIEYRFTGTVIATGPGPRRMVPKAMSAQPLLIKKRVESELKDGGISSMSARECDIIDDAERFSDRFPMAVKVGDRVLVPSTQQHFALDPDDNKNLVFAYRESQILAVLK